MKKAHASRTSVHSPDERSWRAANKFRLRISVGSAKITRPSVRLMLCYQTGAANDPPGLRGLAHVVEHLIRNRATQNLDPSAPVIVERATTELDYTSYAASGPFSEISAIAKVIHQMTEIPSFSESEVKTAINEVILEKENGQIQNPVALAYDVLFEMTFSRHPYRWYTIGRIPDLRKITAADCNRFLDRYYRPENAILRCVLLGFSKKDRSPTAMKDLARVLENAVTHDRIEKTKFKIARHQKRLPAQAEIQTRIIQNRTGSDTMVIGLRSVEPTMTANLKLGLLLQCCKIMYERARSPNAFCFYETFSVPARSAGLMIMNFSRSPGFRPDAQASLETLFDTFRKVTRKSIPTSILKLGLQASIQDCIRIGTLADDLNRSEALNLGPLDWKEKIKILKSVSPSELSRLADKLLRPDGMTIVYSVSQRNPIKISEA